MVSTHTAAILTYNEQIKEQLQDHLEKRGIAVDQGGTSFDETSLYHFLFIGEDMYDQQSLEIFQRASVCIGLLQERSFENVRTWMKQGIQDVVILPDEWERMDELVDDGIEKIERAASVSSGGTGGGEVLTFYSAKGGSGKTLLSAMLAQCLKTQYDKNVIFIDLNAQFGGVEGLMGLEPVRNYCDLLPVLNELSIHHVHNVTTHQEQTELEVLTGPSHPEKAEDVSEELVRTMIQLCREHYDYVIVDLPSELQTVTFTALQEATQIYYPLTPDTLAIRLLKQTKALLDRLQLTTNDKFCYILNKVQSKSEITEKDIKNIVDIEAAGKVRADFFGIQPLINMGFPFYTKKGKVNQSKQSIDVNRFVQKNLVKIKGK